MHSCLPLNYRVESKLSNTGQFLPIPTRCQYDIDKNAPAQEQTVQLCRAFLPAFISHDSHVRHIHLFRPRITVSVRNGPYSDGAGTTLGCQNIKVKSLILSSGQSLKFGVFPTQGSWQRGQCICLWLSWGFFWSCYFPLYITVARIEGK